MAAYFTLTLDTTAPGGGSISISVSPTNTRSVSLSLSATGAAQMKLYGDIGTGSTATTEAAASWETYAASKTVTLTSGDATKTVKVKFRDSVGNETAEYSASTVLDTTAPVVTVVGPDVDTISKVSGYSVSSFSFSADSPFKAWKVKVVPGSGSGNTAGTQLGTANGSTNLSGSSTVAANTAVSCTIRAADLEAASSGDGAKIVKVFVQDMAGNWSV